MNKINELRKHLLARPHLELAPDHFHTFVEQQSKAIAYQGQPKNTGFGALISEPQAKTNKNFRLEYTASIVVTDYAHDFNVLAFEVIEWLDQYEDHRNNANEVFDFKADIISSSVYDVEITVKLTELVTVTEQDGGISINAHVCKRVQL